MSEPADLEWMNIPDKPFVVQGSANASSQGLLELQDSESTMLAIRRADMPSQLSFLNAQGDTVFFVDDGGMVTLGENMSVDDAAAAFWEAINALRPA